MKNDVSIVLLQQGSCHMSGYLLRWMMLKILMMIISMSAVSVVSLLLQNALSNILHHRQY